MCNFQKSNCVHWRFWSDFKSVQSAYYLFKINFKGGFGKFVRLLVRFKRNFVFWKCLTYSKSYFKKGTQHQVPLTQLNTQTLSLISGLSSLIIIVFLCSFLKISLHRIQIRSCFILKCLFELFGGLWKSQISICILNKTV